MSWQQFNQFLQQSCLIPPLVGLAVCSVLGFLVGWLPLNIPLKLLLGFLFLGGMIFALLSLISALYLQVYQPLEIIDQWSEQVNFGRLGERMEIPSIGLFRGIIIQLNTMCGELARLTYYMDAQVNKHTVRLAQKTASLKTLYDVAHVINRSENLEKLLSSFLLILQDMVQAQAAMVRLSDGNGHMHLVGKVGFEGQTLVCEQGVLNEHCVCARAINDGCVHCESDIHCCEQLQSCHLADGKAHEYEVLTIPLCYLDKTLGVYNLFVRKTGLSEREDVKNLLTSIGNHLGMAIDKDRLDKESRRLSILEERTALSHELHDSLAQTLVSLRFQVQVLQDMLQDSGSDEARQETRRIKNGLDEANTELRELIAHFRAPLDKRGLLPALEGLVQRFRRETNINCVLQSEHQPTGLSVDTEMQVLRIVQECLANIRKHSQAQTVRVLLKSETSGRYLVLVEDDGIGITQQALHGHPGEHIGLSIMQERARRLHRGEVKIESEPGEGTRIELTFQQGA